MNEHEHVVGAINELRTTLEKRVQDCITRAEAEKISEDVVNKLHPAERKAALPHTPEEVLERAASFKNSGKNTPEKPWTSEYGKKFGNMKNFLLAAKEKHPMLVDAKSTMQEGSDAVGGYLVPTEFSSEVIRLMYDESIIMRLARVMPMSSWKRTLPKQLTSVTVAWVNELGSKSVTNPTFGQLEQVAKVMAAVIKASDELLRDSAINLTAFLSELVAEAMALEIERVALVGDVSGASDPFNGVYKTSGVNVVTMAGATVDFDDIINLMFSLNSSYSNGAKLVLSRAGLKKLLKLRDDDGNYLWQPPAGNIPSTIWGVPYELSSKIASTYGTGSDCEMIQFGNYGKYLFISPRQGLTVKVSQDASDWVSAALDSAFMTDQTWIRFTQALSIDVAYGTAFSYLLFK